jgi:hypothetical protein
MGGWGLEMEQRMIVDAHNGGMEAKMEHFTLEGRRSQIRITLMMSRITDPHTKSDPDAHLRENLDPDPH